jgi:hypothetical protein
MRVSMTAMSVTRLAHSAGTAATLKISFDKLFYVMDNSVDNPDYAAAAERAHCAHCRNLDRPSVI